MSGEAFGLPSVPPQLPTRAAAEQREREDERRLMARLEYETRHRRISGLADALIDRLESEVEEGDPEKLGDLTFALSNLLRAME